jgi:hypothetical protein
VSVDPHIYSIRMINKKYVFNYYSVRRGRTADIVGVVYVNIVT